MRHWQPSLPVKSGHEHRAKMYHQLEVVHRGIPTIEQHSLGTYSLVGCGIDEHISKVVVLGLAVCLWGKDAVVNRIVITVHPVGMHEVDHSYASYQATLGSTVLAAYQLYLLGVAFILNTVINNQARFLAVIEQWLYKLPQLAGRTLALCKIVRNCVVTDPFQVLCQSLP